MDRCATGAPYGGLWVRPVLMEGLAAEAAPTNSKQQPRTRLAGACATVVLWPVRDGHAPADRWGPRL